MKIICVIALMMCTVVITATALKTENKTQQYTKQQAGLQKKTVQHKLQGLLKQNIQKQSKKDGDGAEQKLIVLGTTATGVDFNPLEGAGRALAMFIGFFALIAAGIAALIAFVIPPLQIANQILAIIAVALLCAYIVQDKAWIWAYKKLEHKYHEDYYYDYPSDVAIYALTYDQPHGYGAKPYTDSKKKFKGYKRSDNLETLGWDTTKPATASSYDTRHRVVNSPPSNHLDTPLGEQARNVGVSLVRSIGNMILGGADSLRIMLSRK